MKKNDKNYNAEELITGELVDCMKYRPRRCSFLKLALIPLLAICVIIPVSSICKSVNSLQDIESENASETVAMANVPIAATNTKKSMITIPVGQMNQNPFLPYRNFAEVQKDDNDVPNYALVEPPDTLESNSESSRIMNTVVSGILYDKYSASAIINIEGSDYLVRKGDVVNNYKIVNILQDSVTVKLGENVYTAGIGEILTEGALYHNEVSNLNEKFGGERK